MLVRMIIQPPSINRSPALIGSPPFGARRTAAAAISRRRAKRPDGMRIVGPSAGCARDLSARAPSLISVTPVNPHECQKGKSNRQPRRRRKGARQTEPASRAKRASRIAMTPPHGFLGPSTSGAGPTFPPAGLIWSSVDICLPLIDKSQVVLLVALSLAATRDCGPTPLECRRRLNWRAAAMPAEIARSTALKKRMNP
jgi:hypothetical protein